MSVTYQVVLILEGEMQVGDPALVAKYKHISLLHETGRLQENRQRMVTSYMYTIAAGTAKTVIGRDSELPTLLGVCEREGMRETEINKYIEKEIERERERVREKEKNSFFFFLCLSV